MTPLLLCLTACGPSVACSAYVARDGDRVAVFLLGRGDDGVLLVDLADPS